METKSDFFSRHISNIKSTGAVCEECGDKLTGQASEVAHILPKGVYKSIATNDENVVYLCGFMSPNNCHTKFDSNNSTVQGMNIFDKIKNKIEMLSELCSERISLSVRKRYQL